jgi:hypothetical protein
VDLETQPPWGGWGGGALPEAVGFVLDQDEGGGGFHGKCRKMLHFAYLFQLIKLKRMIEKD